ncbi:MAG: Sua5 family C-terminal domain-containing protein [Dysosmobacter sp.]
MFDALRTFDNSGVPEIYAQCPDNRGLGLAVGNRLKKAAGFHVSGGRQGARWCWASPAAPARARPALCGPLKSWAAR